MKKRRNTRLAQTHFWDIFRESSTYDHDLSEAQDVFDIGVKILKVIFYVAFAGITLLGTVSSKLSLIFMSKHMIQRKKSYDVNFFWLCSLLVLLCLPHLLSFLRSLLRLIFNGERWPAFGLVVFVVAIDALHAFGCVLLVAKICPLAPLSSSVLIMCSASLVPNFLSAVPRSTDKLTGGCPWALLHRTASLLSFLAQLFVFIFFLALIQARDRMSAEREHSAFWERPFPFSVADFVLEMGKFWPRMSWHLPVAMICISLSWWENYVDSWILPSRAADAVANLKQRLKKKRSNVNFASSVVSMVVIVSFGMYFGLGTVSSAIDAPPDPIESFPPKHLVSASIVEDDANAIAASTDEINDSFFSGGDVDSIFKDDVNSSLSAARANVSIFSDTNSSIPTSDAINLTVSANHSALVNASIFPTMDDDLSILDSDEAMLTNDSMPNNSSFVFAEEFSDEERRVFFTLAGSHLLGSVLAYYCATLACKLHMQPFSFALPLSVSTPVSLIFAMLFANRYFSEHLLLPEEVMVGARYSEFPRDASAEHHHVAVMALLLWVPQVLASVHIWISGEERMAKLDKLFLHPMWSTALIEQEFVLGRRKLKSFIIPPSETTIPTPDVLVLSAISETSLGEGAKAENAENKEEGAAPAPEDPVDPAEIPVIYLCATCWHETESEMLSLLKSLFRMDADQTARRLMRETLKRQDADYYEFEGHVFFDDCMEVLEDWEEGGPGKIPNQFVRQFVSVIDQAASEVHDVPLEVRPPTKMLTPYGGRLIWTLPGGNKLVVHLKDKDLIRHKKRWSQVMYMYFLLGYRMLKDAGKIEANELNFGFAGYDEENEAEEAEDDHDAGDLGEKKKRFKLFKGFGRVLKDVPDDVYRRAHNTYILALDGDVDFKPSNVLLLLDRLKKNERVGAACGRIHPIGGGVIVWYQMFEYAVAHWLQKAAEHVLGCVLCSPGCFSLFRGSALMDDDVMKTYTMKSSEARHYIQYDQGEDRWLCTLLLQSGWRVEYCAASDAWTNAPTGMREFFNQRRRWIPSTIANIVNLLEDARKTRKKNSTISYPYIVYQVFLLVSTILTPATIVMVIANAIHTVLGLPMGTSAAVSALPALSLVVLGFTIKPDNQILAAAVLCTLYSLVMASVIVSSIIEISHDTVASPNAAFFFLLSGTTIVAALLHPREIACLLPALLYLLAIPAGYLILPIYSFCNLHVVSWGTREVKKLTKEEKEKLSSGEIDDNRLTSWQWFQKLCGIFWRMICTCCPLDRFIFNVRSPSSSKCDAEVLKILREINGNLEKIVKNQPEVGGQSQSMVLQTGSITVRELDPDLPDLPDSLESAEPHFGRKKFEREKSMLRKVLDPNAADDTQTQSQDHLGTSPISVRITTPSGPLHKSSSLGTVYFPSSTSLQTQETPARRLEADIFKSLPNISQASPQKSPEARSITKDNCTRSVSSERVDGSSPTSKSTPRLARPWILHESLKDGPIRSMRSEKETKFWKDLIARYLHPLEKNSNQQAKVASDLKELRNNVVFGLIMGNAIWILILVQLMTLQERLEPYYLKLPRWNPGYVKKVNETLDSEDSDGNLVAANRAQESLKVEPLAFIYLVFFGVILSVQFFAMLVHRWSTVLHLVASSNLWGKTSTPVAEMEHQKGKKEAKQAATEGNAFMQHLQFRPANEVLNLIRQLQRPGRFDDDDFDARSVASAASIDAVDGEDSYRVGRYNVRTEMGRLGDPTNYLNVPAPFTPMAIDPVQNFRADMPSLPPPPGPTPPPPPPPAPPFHPQMMEPHSHVSELRSRPSTLGISFQHRLDRLRTYQLTPADMMKNRLETQI